jgi:hypothetical protein
VRGQREILGGKIVLRGDQALLPERLEESLSVFLPALPLRASLVLARIKIEVLSK